VSLVDGTKQIFYSRYLYYTFRKLKSCFNFICC